MLTATQRLEGKDLWNLLSRLRAHPVARLRQLATWTIVKGFPERAEESLRQALFDQHVGVRGIAQQQLGALGIDVPAAYRAALSATPRAALLGLGDVGSKPDADLVALYLAAPQTGIRRAAVRAVARLDPDRHLEELLDALADPSPSVSREARKGLERSARRVPARIWDICRDAAGPHVRRNCFALLATLPKWDLLRFGLIATIERQPELDVGGQWLLKLALTRWNRSFTSPSNQQLADIRSLLEGAESQLDPGMARELHFSLGSFRDS